jgi:hypothetical protein
MSDKSVVERAKKAYEKYKARMAKSHEIGRECIAYVSGDQWTPEDLRSRESTSRPCITINKLDVFVRSVVNKFAMELPRITVSGFEEADAGKTRVINGLLRHIQYSDMSDSREAVEHAMFCLVVCGFGYMMVDSDYIDDESMDQELMVKKVKDPFTTFVGDDSAIIVSKIDKDTLRNEYGKDAKVGTWDDMPIDDDEAVIVEYWERKSTPGKLYKIVPVVETSPIDATIGQTFGSPEQPGKPIVVKSLEEYPGAEIIDERDTVVKTVTKYTISGGEIALEERVDGGRIPVVMVSAAEYETRSGDKFYKPLVFDALPAQRIYNYYRSQDAEYLQMQTKVPYVGVEGQFDGHEQEWEQSNVAHTPYLEYRPVAIGGSPAPPPQRTPPPGMSQGFYNNMLQASDEIKATIGIFDASLGAQGNETSGRAILARTQQGDVATFHITLAMRAAMRELGLILVSLIPIKYDTERTIRILGDDMAPEVVKINGDTKDKDGRPVLYNMTVGKYDVVVESGPSGYTRRMAMVEDMLDFIKAVPPAGAVAGDFLARAFEFDHADELANRLKAAIPPEILDRAKQYEQGANGQQAQSQQAAAMQSQMAKMQEALQRAMQQLQGVSAENAALKRRINDTRIMEEQIQAKANLQKEEIRSTTDLRIADIDNRTKIEVEKIKQGLAAPVVPAPFIRPALQQAVPGPIYNPAQTIRRE